MLGDDIVCDHDDLRMASFVAGYGDPPFNGLDGLELEVFPASASLIVERDGVVVLEDDFSIEPEVTYPNGADCEPECRECPGTIVHRHVMCRHRRRGRGSPAALSPLV